MALSVNVTNISGWTSAYHDRGKYAYKISNPTAGVFNVKRANTAKYRMAKKTLGPYATMAAAIAGAEADMQIARPAGVAATTITAGFTQPAVGATVVAAFASATGYAVGMNVNIVGGGVYTITNIAGLSITIRNTGAAGNAAPTTAVSTGGAVSAVAGLG